MDENTAKPKAGLQERIENLRTWTSHEEVKLPFYFEHVVFVIFATLIFLLIIFTT